MKEKKEKKENRWIRFRHKVMRNLLAVIMPPIARFKYGLHIEHFRKPDKKQPYLILYNHQTPMDQFFVGMTVPGTIYYVASEDIFSNGFVSSLIRYFVAPIPIRKQAVDVRAIVNCMKVAKEGGSIAIAPEGNRTYSGKTGFIKPGIAPLARKLGLPVALLRVEGGFGKIPRYADKVRKGRMTTRVSRVLSPEEIAAHTDDELLAIIREELAVDDATAPGPYRGKRLAEYVERALYTCPFCGLTTLESEGNVVRCLRCERKVRFLPSQKLVGEGFDFPYATVGEWYDGQCDFVASADFGEGDAPLYVDCVDLYNVVAYKKKERIKTATRVELFIDRVRIFIDDEAPTELPFDIIRGAAVLGRNKLNLTDGTTVYQCKGSKRFNALKYLNFYHRYLNRKKGTSPNDKFLGL